MGLSSKERERIKRSKSSWSNGFLVTNALVHGGGGDVKNLYEFNKNKIFTIIIIYSVLELFVIEEQKIYILLFFDSRLIARLNNISIILILN